MINGEPTNAANECWVIGAGVGVTGAGNLMQNNNNCEGVVTTGDPQLGPLQNNGGFTPTMAIPETSAAFNAADVAPVLSRKNLSTSSLSQNRGNVFFDGMGWC